MKNTIFVCLIASTLTMTSAAQMQTPPMRQGVSVQMARTANATAMPAADNEDAWVVAVTADGRMFFDVKPVTPESLTEVMKETPRHRDQDVYIKADARTDFRSIKPALKAAAVDRFETAVLLTSQNETASLGKLVAPKGLPVILAPGSTPVAVQLRDSGQKLPKVLVNDREIILGNLQNALNQALQGQNNRTVQLRVDDNLLFAQVAQVIDVCSSVKANVMIPTE